MQNKMEFGIDIVDISRIQKMIDTFGSKFLLKVFSPREVHEAKAKGHFAQSLSGKFAAKEAFIKTCPAGEFKIFTFSDIEILSDESGKPTCFFQGSKKDDIVLSISHERTYAVAGVIRIFP
ncbi:MAG TPA: holo-ACP synthase [Caldisericia bacterium]|nr:holo-ACP synthase [Caldisericia bacterium]